MTPEISAHGLRKRYGAATPVDGIDFEVAPGEIFGFLGPNGAGKSTTINMLCSLLDPTEGRATVAGYDVNTEKESVRRNIGLVFQDSVLDGYLTAEQNLRFHGDLYGLPRELMKERVQQVLDMVGLTGRRYDTASTYSGGMKRRLEIARGLLHSPRVLFLDEPTAGLDPESRHAIWNHVLELRETAGITVFMTTHYLEEAEYCDRIAIIDHGRIVVLDTPEALKSGVGSDRVTVTTPDIEAVVRTLRDRFDLPAEGDREEGTVRFSVPGGAEFVPMLFHGFGAEITSVQVNRPSLDDVFLRHTGTKIDSDGANRPGGSV